MLFRKNKPILFSFAKILDNLNPYKILGVSQTASAEQIKTKYYKLAQKYHPDLDSSYHAKFQEINQAYSLLKDAQKRKQIDKNLSQGNPAVWAKSYYARSHHYGNTAKQNYKYQEYENSRKNKDNGKYAQYHNKEYNANIFVKGATSAILFYKRFKYFLMVTFGLCFSFIMVEFMIGVYEFNRGVKKYTPLED